MKKKKKGRKQSGSKGGERISEMQTYKAAGVSDLRSAPSCTEAKPCDVYRNAIPIKIANTINNVKKGKTDNNKK